jgi:cytidylate kinase
MNSYSSKHLIIAVDGFSSTGKSTLAQDIAKHYGIRYIDSGAMYRAVTLYAINKDLIDPKTSIVDEKKLKKEIDNIKIDFRRTSANQQSTYLNGKNVDKEIRQMAVNNQVSHISKIRFVRKKMVEKQREFAREGGVVMDGRDIGTVVFPGADIKLFITASAEIRADRRFKELKEKGIAADFNDVLTNLKERDAIDQNRETSPLKKAPDAYEIDNSNLSRKEQLKEAINIIENR